MAESDAKAEAARLNAARWSEIATLRGAGSGNAASIDRLLAELSDGDDLHAIVQQAILGLDQRVASGELKHCEAFAQGMEALARAVSNQSLPPGPYPLGPPNWREDRRMQFLGLAWAYFASHDEHVTYSIVPIFAGHESRGGWEGTAPAWVGPHIDALAGSGYMAPRADDSDVDRSGRKAHLIANALLTMHYSVPGDIPRGLWGQSETSSTDNDVNKLGADLGHLIAMGTVTYENIAAWITANLCTEGQCTAGTLGPEALQALRYGTVQGTVTRHEEVSTLRTNTLNTSRWKRNYVEDETWELTTRVQLQPGMESAQFGDVVEGTWNRTARETIVNEGHSEERTFEERNFPASGTITEVGGELWVETGLAGDYQLHISGVRSAALGERIATEDLDTVRTPRVHGHVCIDGTLSGADSRQTSASDEKILYGPDRPGEFTTTLGGDPYTERSEHKSNARWSWKFTIAPVSPAHQAICTNMQTATEMDGASTEFLTRVSHQLIPLNQSESEFTRTNALRQDFMNIYPALWSLGAELREKWAIARNRCESLDTAWISNDPVTDSNYAKDLAELKKDLDSFTKVKEQIVDYLASQAEGFAENVRQKDGVAASNIDDLARQLRIEGLEAFVR